MILIIKSLKVNNMIARNSIVKNTGNFSEHNSKNFAWKFHTVTENRQKTKKFHSVITSM